MKIESFAAKHSITIESEETGLLEGESEWSSGATHYNCTLRMGRKRMTVRFHMGAAICREPSVSDVLDCLITDSDVMLAGGEIERFEAWASNFGYDTDSRKAEQTYRACVATARKLVKFLGEKRFDDLRDCERL